MATTLSDITEFIIDTKHNTPEYAEHGYPCIRTPNIGRGYFILEDVKYVDEKTYLDWIERAVPRSGDLILAREAPVGNVAWIPPDIKPCIGQRTVLIRPRTDSVDSRYLTYLLLGDECQNRMHSMSGGATVAHLNMSDIRTLELPDLPPLPTQRKIAAILSAYDDLVENNTRRITLLEQMAQLLYREWFVRFHFPGHEPARMVESELGEIPEGWEVVKLGEALELVYGKGLTKENRVSGPYPVYGSSGIVDYHQESFVKGPGIIVGRKGNVGTVFWSYDDFYPIDTVFYVKTDVCLHYVFYNLQNQNFISTDTAVPGLSRNMAYLLPFLLPEKSILDEFQNNIEPIFRQIENLRLRNTLLRRARDLLLPRLISGEVDVSEVAIAGLD